MLIKNVAEEINPLGIIDNAIIGKDGSLTIVYQLEEPDCYSLGKESFDKINQIYFNAFCRFKDHVIIHKQDIYVRKEFDSSVIQGNSFIQNAERKYFKNKNYLDHICYLSFTLCDVPSLSKSYISNPFKYKDNIDKESLVYINTFLEDISTVNIQLMQISKLKISELSKNDIIEYFSKYRSLNLDFLENQDVKISDKITDGRQIGSFYCIDEVECLPNSISTQVKDTSLLLANSDVYASYLESVGIQLPYTHIINQIWKFNTTYKSDFSLKVKQFGQHKSFDKEIEKDYNQLDNLNQELVDSNNIICKYHFNLFLLETETEFLKAEEKIKGEFRLRDIKVYIPKYANLYNIFIGSMIGNENNLKSTFFFLVDLKTSLAITVQTSKYKEDKEGIFFNDRLHLKPAKLDIWNRPHGNKIPARNGIVMASTGGGKSVLTLNIAQQFLEQGYKVVVVEFGSSFKQLTQLYPDKSLHIDYDKDTPLGINPFFIPDGKNLDSEKAVTLTHFILKFMRDKSIKNDIKQEVSMRNLIESFYKIDKEKNFVNFYNYISEKKDQLFDLYDIKKDFFDVDTFLHVCKDFLEGGTYENVIKESENSNKIQEKDFIVFELTKIKNDKFLISVVLSIILEVIQMKLLDRSSKGILLFDEYAEVQQIKDDFEGDDIHAIVAFCYQKIRKENGCVYTVVQTPDQFRDDEYSKGIISNTQLLYVLPTTETVYNSIISKFNIVNQDHIEMMKSISYNYDDNLHEKYSEFFLRILDKDAVVIRLHLSPEKLMSFQTDGDLWLQVQKDAKEIGIEDAIIKNINTQK